MKAAIAVILTGFASFPALAMPTPAAPLAAQADPAAAIGEARDRLSAGDLEGAEKILRALLDTSPEDPRGNYLLGYTLHARNLLEEALVFHTKAAGYASTKKDASYNAACAHARLGDLDAAYRWLRKAVRAGFDDRGRADTDPDLVALRAEPRYGKIFPPMRRGAEAFRETGLRVLHELVGEASQDQFGWVARRVGDLDADGCLDFGTSAPTHASAGPAAGRVYVYSGRTGVLLFQRDGKPGEQLGNSVMPAGDVNGDGVPDVLVGAPCSAGAPGRAYVLSGTKGAVLLELSAGEPGDRFGLKGSGAGDVDGDGHADLAIGAPSSDRAGKDAGRVYVYSGKTGSLLYAIDGAAPGEQLGSAIDATRDGKARLLAVGAMGRPGGGRAYVYRLEKSGARLAFPIDPDETSVNLGQYFVTILGDVDRDGVPDVYASDWNNRAKGPATGRVFVHSGKTGERILTITGHRAGEGFGTSVSDAGDVDGDGSADLIVGAWQNPEGGKSAGKCYLHSGRDGKLLATYTSAQPGDTLGFDATHLGDVDGDGGIDFLLTSAWSGIQGPRSGRVFVVAGPAPAAKRAPDED